MQECIVDRVEGGYVEYIIAVVGLRYVKLEKRSDLLLSTLRKTIEAMGGNLSLVAEFPDRAPVVLSGIAEDDPRA